MTGKRAFEFYPTPAWMTDHLLDRLGAARGLGLHESEAPKILEPCVGQGHIVNTIRRRCPLAKFSTNDLDPRHEADSHDDATSSAYWHSAGWAGWRPDWIITNPPFSEAFDIVREAVDVARVGVAMLLRITWLEPLRSPEGKARALWLAEHPPAAMYVMERFSFDGSGSVDSATSAWFVWARITPTIEVIVGRGRQEGLGI